MNPLYKLTSLPTLFRLLLCLLISAGVHGGAVWYGAFNTAADQHEVSAPLFVSLLELEKVSLAPADAPQVVEPPVTKKRAVAHKAVATSSKAAAAKPAALRQEIEPASVAKAAQSPAVARVAAETAAPVCVPSQGGEPLSLEVAANQAASVEPARQEVLLASRADTLATAPVELGAEVIEAVPNYRSNPLPEYPYLARQKHWEGVVWLLVDVSAEGRVDDLIVEQSCGHRTLDRSATRAVKSWQFTPATRAGLPVASQVRIPVRFRLEGS